MTRLQTPLETGAFFFMPAGLDRYDRRMLALFDSLRHWLDGIAHLGSILAVAYLLYLFALAGWIDHAAEA